MLEIAKFQSISQAAKSLYISQPALSRFLANLEDDLQTPLFVRGKNMLTLTEGGKIYVEYAQAVREKHFQMLNTIEALRSHRRSIIWIGYTLASNFPTFAYTSQEFNTLHPDVELQFIRVYSRDIKANLLDSTLAFALSSPPDEGDPIAYHNCFSSPLLVVIPKSFPLSLSPVMLEDGGYPWVDIRALADLPFALADKTSGIRKLIDKSLADMGVTLRNVPITTDNSLSALFYTEQGKHLCITTENIINNFQMRGKYHVYRFGTPPVTRKSGILHLKAKDFTAPEKACFELLKKYYSSTPSLKKSGAGGR
ncbi:LysR family transcriptional regulator [Parasphaerochaeta coccoides]|uniref:LysR family transcriptional regulator n=1 Tax=Parasphaerochaeta coccoides TaxID=273376 RepID=UPI0024788925|nr:LysR family transcriptional regulator [Parasphaerochaeta coccoides]